MKKKTTRVVVAPHADTQSIEQALLDYVRLMLDGKETPKPGNKPHKLANPKRLN